MKKMKTRNFKDRLKEELKNKSFAAEFKKEYDLASLGITLAELRAAKGLSQQQLAKKIHTSQQAISRMESAENAGCNISTLIRIAEATGTHLKLSFTKVKA